MDGISGTYDALWKREKDDDIVQVEAGGSDAQKSGSEAGRVARVYLTSGLAGKSSWLLVCGYVGRLLGLVKSLELA